MLTFSWSRAIAAVVLTIFVAEITAITIIHAPQDQSVVQGGTVIFRCTISNKGNFQVYWFFDRANRYLSFDTVFFEDSRNPRFSIVGNQGLGEFNLRITNVQVSDAGVYRCGFIPTGTNMLTSRAARLTVLVPPDDGFPRCEVSPPAGMINLGQRATLICTSQGGTPPASLTWLQNGFEISPAVLHRNVIERTFDSSLNGVRFTCRAMSPAIMRERTCSLIPLSIDPTVRVDPPQLIARPGENAVFRCIAGGVSPIVEFSWTFGVISVSSLDDRFQLSVDHRTLTIRNVQLADDRTSVHCTVATNNGLSATAGAQLRVVSAQTETITTTYTTTLTPTTLTPNRNQTQPLPTPEYTGGLGTGSIIGIIIGSIAVSQIIIVITVFISHKVSSKSSRRKGRMPVRGESIVPSLAGWQGQQVIQLVPYQGLDASARSASVFRYLTLHPLRTPPTRFSSSDVGVYEAASDPNTNTMVYESGYVQQSMYTGNARVSMNDDYDSYQPAMRSSAVTPTVYEQPRESVNLNDQTSNDGDYYEPPEEIQKLASNRPKQGLDYKPPPDNNGSPLPADSEAYELPPVQSAIMKSGGEVSQQTDDNDGEDEREYYEPPVEIIKQTPDMNKTTSAHVYDVATGGDDEEYEIPEGTNVKRR